MPKRKDINSILIVGAGPIVIGQACEFDYSGTQACKALRAEGFRVILVNSNPATIMTDKDIADVTYLEPITLDSLESIIIKEKPNALLPTVGGQTALDISVKLSKKGILDRYNVELIGAQISAIKCAENRESFKLAMNEIGIDTAKGGFAKSIDDAQKIVKKTSFPAIIRPSFTMGGTGGSIAYNKEEFDILVERGIGASPINEVLIEESLIGWKEFEMEVVRDSKNNSIIVCSIENIDPMGIHTGDSITVAPSQTLSDKEYQKMRDWSIMCLRKIGVDTGGSNVQFAINPKNGRMIIIEMNPRVSRSSALASKATGFPIAKIAAKLSVGFTLDELYNDITKTTLAAFEPSIDYVVTKIPRFDFEKFPTTSGILGVQMQSVGEVMSIGRTFRESLQKAFRSLELGFLGYDLIKTETRDLDITKIRYPTAFRLLKIKQAFQLGYNIKEVHDMTHIDQWFLFNIKDIIRIENLSLNQESILDSLKLYKSEGFSDKQIADKYNLTELVVRNIRKENNILPTYKVVDTCASEFKAITPYCYSTYEDENEVIPLEGKKIIILGGGPNRIGQGIEFDYCCVQAVFGLQELKYKTIMINCNPETVSTDFDIADRLYFEPLTYEDVMNIIDLEKPDGVLIQFGGQTPLNIAKKLYKSDVNIIGTSPNAIDLAEDREKFGKMLSELDIPAPNWGTAYSINEAKNIAKKIGYPVLVRPSYVLGGKGMQIIYNDQSLMEYVSKATKLSGNHPILIDKFLEDAFEFDVDALCDGSDVFIAGIMQHIEQAGIHSGDSACVFPAYELESGARKLIEEYTKKLALSLHTIGLINIQFAIQNNIVYVIEVNPRASRTVPFISKIINIPLAKIAAQISVGEKINTFNLKKYDKNLIGIKKPVFPFNKFPEQSVFLSPEMKSTGEVIGFDSDIGSAYAKAQAGVNEDFPLSGAIFISVNDQDKIKVIPIARDLIELGFTILSTRGTSKLLNENGIQSNFICKVGEGRPNIVDRIKNNEIQLIINTPLGEKSRFDEHEIGKASIKFKVPAVTTIAAAKFMIRAIRMQKNKAIEYKSLQEIFN